MTYLTTPTHTRKVVRRRRKSRKMGRSKGEVSRNLEREELVWTASIGITGE